MHFDLSPEQRAVRDAVRELCQARAGSAAARRYGSGEDDGADLWSALVRAGWTAAAVPERYGGQGLGIIELGLACGELAQALANSMFLGAAASALLLAEAGSAAQRARWLHAMAAGEARAALAMRRPDGGALVFDAQGADVVVVVGNGGAMIVPSSGCTFTPVPGVDATRRLDRVEVREAEVIPGDVAPALDRIEILVAAELVGIAQRALDLAVEHARTRVQFGRPIGTNQAVSHRCANMLVDVESARSAMLFAAWTADHDAHNLPFAASVAKASAAEGAWRVAVSSLQVHGGIGFTWEHDCHLLLRRAAASARLLGSAGDHVERAAAQRGLGPGRARQPRPQEHQRAVRT